MTRACRGTGPAEHLAGHHRAHGEQSEAHVRLQRRKAAAAAAVDLPEESVAMRDDRPFGRLSSAPLRLQMMILGRRLVLVLLMALMMPAGNAGRFAVLEPPLLALMQASGGHARAL